VLVVNLNNFGLSPERNLHNSKAHLLFVVRSVNQPMIRIFYDLVEQTVFNLNVS
jgi:hypothetical protein